jgi:hypothetical protein
VVDAFVAAVWPDQPGMGATVPNDDEEMSATLGFMAGWMAARDYHGLMEEESGELHGGECDKARHGESVGCTCDPQQVLDDGMIIGNYEHLTATWRGHPL